MSIYKKFRLFIIVCILLTSCQKEICLDCQCYDVSDFNGDLETFYHSFIVCEDDNMWQRISWYEHSQEGGIKGFVDLDIYTVGFRTIENLDIDHDGILNENDNDIDGDGILNEDDYSSEGLDNNTTLELVICTEIDN